METKSQARCLLRLATLAASNPCTAPPAALYNASVSGLILSLIWGWEQAACKVAVMQSMPEADEQIGFCPFAGRDVSKNQITGSLPTEVGNLGSLQDLYSPSCCPFSSSVSGFDPESDLGMGTSGLQGRSHAEHA